VSANDRRRFRAFADFLHINYPSVETIADVAGGHGRLSYHLHQHGFAATVIDTRRAELPRRMQRTLRKQSIEQRRLIEIPRVIARVQEVDLGPFDLIVGLHPDEATEPAIRSAIALGTQFAIVPCCPYPIDGIRRSEANWLEYLASLSPDVETATLPIDGANRVLYRRTPFIRDRTPRSPERSQRSAGPT
jgi:hypothetical protein